jgi:hypothetical protein
MRGVPADVDLTIPSTVRDALARDHSMGSSALSGNKTGHFSDTLALTGGVPTRFPISVNDVWVGKMFGVPDDVMSSNQSLHEPMALYFNKIRDLYNQRHGDEVPFKYQSWNFQAPAWVHLRNGETGDAYHQVWGGIINKLKNAGVPGIEGDKITRDAFMHPKFADALRRTTPDWRSAPKATVEFGTKLTDIGQKAHDLYTDAIANGDQKSQQEYLKPLVTGMYHSARGKDHPWEALKKAITGELGVKSDITRIANPTSESPLTNGGTFEGALSPNIRIPLKDMSDDQIAMFNAVAGKHLKQAAMAVSQIHAADHEHEPHDGYIRGHSLFQPTDREIDPAHIREFAQHLSGLGHDISFAQYPNGYNFDVLPNFGPNGAKGIDQDTLESAYDATLKKHFNEPPKIMAHDFRSVYNTASEYDKLRLKLKRNIQDDYIKAMVGAGISKDNARQAISNSEISSTFKGRSRKAWNTYQQRLNHLSNAEEGFKDLARSVNDGHTKFIDSATKRRQKLGYRAGGAIRRAYKKGGKVEGSIWHEKDAYGDGGTTHEPHQRAEEQGYSIKGYHFTRGPKAQSIAKSKQFDPYLSEGGENATFFWDNPQAANDWAHFSGGVDPNKPQEKMTPNELDRLSRFAPSIFPVRIHPGKHTVVNWPEATGLHSYDNVKMKKLIQNARNEGYDTVRIKNMREGDVEHELEKYPETPHDQIAVLNPNVIRSEFAQFDPARQHENDIGARKGGTINKENVDYKNMPHSPIVEHVLNKISAPLPALDPHFLAAIAGRRS